MASSSRAQRLDATIDGEVQETGFRAYLRLVARRLKVAGYAENLGDGTVHVVAEGPSESLDDLLSEIRNGRFREAVIEIKEQRGAASGGLEPFKVKIGDLGEELFQGFATAGRKLDELRQDVRQVGEKVDASKDSLGRKIDDMRADINANFQDLRERYDGISGTAAAILEELSRQREDFRETLERTSQ